MTLSQNEIDLLKTLPGVYCEVFSSRSMFINFGGEPTYIDIDPDHDPQYNIYWELVSKDRFYKEIVEPLLLKMELQKLIEE